MGDNDNTNFGQDQGLRIVLVGKTGVGKSASGNTILGENKFYSHICPSSVTSCCGKGKKEVNGINVAVVDTPGLFDTRRSNKETLKEILKCICLSSPGPHVFLVVLQLGRFTKEEQDTVEIIKTTFGPASAKYTMVLFTHGDQLDGMSIDKFIGHGGNELADFIRQCHGGCHVFDNEDTNNHTQVPELLQKIDEMVQRNGGRCYTNELYREAEAAIQAETKKGIPRIDAELVNWFLKLASNVSSFAATGASIGKRLGSVGAAIGTGVGAGVGIIVHFSNNCTTQ